MFAVSSRPWGYSPFVALYQRPFHPVFFPFDPRYALLCL